MIDLTEHLPDLPAELYARAFGIGSHPWPAWQVPDALAVIAHLRSYSLAVTWLYSVTKTYTNSWTHYTTKMGDYERRYNPDIKEEESWQDFVDRTCSEASDLLRHFKPVHPIITPQPFRFGFLLMWDAEEAMMELHEQRVARDLANRPALSFDEELALFRVWADSYPIDTRHGSWEADYNHWPQMKAAFDEFLQRQPFHGWNSRTILDVLYTIARDNDASSLAHAVAKEPERLLSLAQAAVESSERDAKWQLAVEMGNLDRPQYPAEPLLLALFRDEDEYVRRRALMALGQMRSPIAEELAADAWATGEEYQRMAALQALHDLDSPQMTDYLEKAEQDSSQHLRAFAAHLKAGRL